MAEPEGGIAHASPAYKGGKRRIGSSRKTKARYGGTLSIVGEGEGEGEGGSDEIDEMVFAHSPQAEAAPRPGAQPPSPVRRRARAARSSCAGALAALVSPALRRRCISHPLAEFCLMVATLWALFGPDLVVASSTY